MNGIHVYVNNDLDIDINQLLEQVMSRHMLNNISGGGNTRRERLMELRRENLLPRGLMEEELSFLNMYKLSSNIEESCSVCRDGYAISQEVIELPCNHKFHKTCLLPWLANHTTCPICRFNIRRDNKDLMKIMMYLTMYSNLAMTIIPYLFRDTPEANNEDNEINRGFWSKIKNKFGRYISSFF